MSHLYISNSMVGFNLSLAKLDVSVAYAMVRGVKSGFSFFLSIFPFR